MAKPLKNSMPSKIKKLYNDMGIKEINQLLKDKNITPEFRKMLEEKKKILLHNKVVKK